MGKVTPTMRIGNPGPGEEDFKMCLSEACVGMANGLFQSMNRSMDPCENFYEFTCGRLVENTVIPEDKSSWSEIAILNKDLQQKGKFLLEKEGSQDDWEIFKDMRKFYRSCLNEDEMDKIAYEPLTEVLDTLGGWPVLEENLIEGLEDQHVKAYFKYMQDITELMGADRNASHAELKDVLLFEMELAQISAPKEERRDRNKLYNPTLLKDFESLPGHPPSWTSFVDNLVYTHNITEDERVLIGNPEFFKKLSDVMTKASPRTLANYIGWRFVKSIVGITTRDARDAALEYSKVTSGTQALPARWKTCVSAAGFGTFSESSFIFAAGSLYAKHYFPKEAKSIMNELIENVRESFTEIINDIEWMDDVTKGKAIEKLVAMDQMIGYPDEILEEDKVTSRYEGVVVEDGKYFASFLSLRRRSRTFGYEQLREEIDKKAWHELGIVAMVNAFYDWSKNMIFFPAGVLRGNFFNHKAPAYVNYGAVGMADTSKKFEEKAQCIIDQANNYESKQVGVKLNGINTQGENIADNGGLAQAYKAFEKHLAKNGMDPMLPGLPFTPRQLFWISFGRVWCKKSRDEHLKTLILLDSHAPNEFRVNGALSYNKEFARDFQCPIGSPMNPEEKCRSMNRSMDPCENFYEFTCGRLVENTVIPEDKSSWSEIAILNKDLQQKGKFLLEKEGSQDDWEIFKDMRKFYRSCLNEDEMDKIAYEPLTEVLDTLGGWPVLEGKNWDRTDYKWYENIYYLNKEGYSMDMVVDLHIYGDAKNSTWRTIHLDQPMLGLSREYLIEGLEDQHVKAYFKYMQDITELMGADRNASEAELKDVLLFEMELAQISAPKEERRDRNKLYNPTLLKDFESLPGHPPSWTSFVDNLVYTHNITEDERVLIGNPEFFKKLSDEGYSMDMMVDLYIYGDAKNSTWRTIHLDQPVLGLSREYLIEGLEDQHVKAYFKYMQDITELMGADRNASEAELKDVLLFEMELAQISAPKEERRDRNKLYNPTLLKDFESLPGHPPSWTSFVDNLVYTHNITEDERVLIGNPEFFKKLSDVMTKASPRTLANYIGWRFVKSIVGITTRDARDAALEYAKVTSGTNELPARWETCVKATGFGAHSRNSFLFGTGSLYAKHYFPKEAKLGLKGLIRNVRASFKEILDDIDWMDDGTKGKAYEKLAAMDQMIGFPDEILEEDKVTSMYKGVQIQEGQHFQNILSLRRRSRQFQYERLREEVDKKAWHERATVAMVNALYSPTKNMILFPAGILGGFFFNTDAPPYHNYGAIGVVIGHEITHGFDDQGRRNDQNGDLADWWDEDTAQKFEDKAQCIINQANNFESAQVQLKLNGINTQGENIADNGGISEAYRAYAKNLASGIATLVVVQIADASVYRPVVISPVLSFRAPEEVLGAPGGLV
eukprot:snap_masked-scaffold243_size241480-processed-gene-1.14 protein:Tk02953 transcript:snap_masked-scaffold243_size241480-processed-gene-1.14-mRNA-1 annotation:"PREDICTED: neprilysin-2-like"